MTEKNWKEQTARDLIRAHIDSDPWELIESLREAGKRRARAVGVHRQLDDLKKVVFADLKEEYRAALISRGAKYTEGVLDAKAYADNRYRKHIASLARAAEQLSHAESEYWAIRSELDWDRAALAHMNALARLEE